MNCKPGVLAMIRGITTFPEDNGKIVEVLSLAFEGEIYASTSGFRTTLQLSADDGVIWRVRARTPFRVPIWGKDFFFDDTPIPDGKLIPISGAPVHDEQLEEVRA